MENFKVKITAPGKGATKFELADLKSYCWECIIELERLNPQTVEEFGQYNLFDNLLQNYYTWKMVFSEYCAELTPEMVQIEEFVTKYLKRFFIAIQLEELNNQPPAFQFN